MTTALSIHLPDELASASTTIAKHMHISRSQFIRLAVENEIKAFKLRKEQEKMAHGFKMLANDPNYLDDIEEIVNLETPLNNEEDEWWN